jgi:hypothetical protein
MNCPWESIDSFVSHRELNQFLAWIGDQIAQGRAAEVEVLQGQEVIHGERWFKRIGSGTIWRLVPADGPLAPGFWPVEN